MFTISSPTPRRPRRYGLVAAAGFLAVPVLLATPATTAQADTSCTTQISQLRNAMTGSAPHYPATLVIQREDNGWTSFSTGDLYAAPNGHLKGGFTQSFSDRSYYSSTIAKWQNFNAASTASHTVDVGPTGVLTIHSDAWGDSSTDMSCTGHVLTKYNAADKQVLTLTTGPLSSIR